MAGLPFIAQVCTRTGLQVSTGALLTTAAPQVPELHVRQLNLWMPDPEEEEEEEEDDNDDGEEEKAYPKKIIYSEHANTRLNYNPYRQVNEDFAVTLRNE